jgi:predicted acyl esterase
MNNPHQVAFTQARRPEDGDYPGFDPSVRIENALVIEQDDTIMLRDGTRIFTDVYRPQGGARVPAIVAWSPYGKRGGFWRYSLFPENAGVPLDAISPWAKFEGPDPAYWCRHGYAVINPDVRGAWKSEGDLAVFGEHEGDDIHDTIEWVAAQPWSNGKVGMSGNSYLALSQWKAGAARPAHLAALAPWEGAFDIYRELAVRGGIPETKFLGEFMHHMYGSGRIEDLLAMQRTHPLCDDYWKAKTPDVSKIEVPVYVVASWTNPVHARGTLEAFKALRSPCKWLRIHDSHEWADFHRPDNREELRRFFDRYLKGEENGWEQTPPVRLMLLDGVDTSIGPFIEPHWPIARACYQSLYLDAATGTLKREPVVGAAQIAYAVADEDAAENAGANFDFSIEADTAVVGHMALRLWVEADGADDMDLFVGVVKVATDGAEVGYDAKVTVAPGALGWLRVSQRRLDGARSRPEQPRLKHEDEQRLSPGEIVPVDIEIWPWGGIWHAGELLRVKISPRPLSTFVHEGSGRNAGRHILHTGGQYDAHLRLPIVDDMSLVGPDARA